MLARPYTSRVAQRAIATGAYKHYTNKRRHLRRRLRHTRYDMTRGGCNGCRALAVDCRPRHAVHTPPSSVAASVPGSVGCVCSCSHPTLLLQRPRPPSLLPLFNTSCSVSYSLSPPSSSHHSTFTIYKVLSASFPLHRACLSLCTYSLPSAIDHALFLVLRR